MPNLAPASAKTWRNFALAAAALALGFGVPLWRLVKFAVHDDLHSHIPLMPLVSLYLVWVDQKNLPENFVPARKWAVFFFAGGLAALAWADFFPTRAMPDQLVPFVLGLLFFWAGAGCWILGAARMRALAFPLALLLFMVPFPQAVRSGIETVLQHGSATVADWMFTLAGTPVFRQDMAFHLPGMNLEVAPECSGIHSTLCLFITSLVAGKFFLRSPGRRAVLCLAVIPLALLRNGFRVAVIGELCVHVGPRMIDSPLHHHGGPLFFVLSLLPFSLLLYWLNKSNRRDAGRPPVPIPK